MSDRLVRPCPRLFRRTVFIGALLLSAVAVTFAHHTDDAVLKALHAVSADRMRADIATLSSAEFNGRQAGTDDDLRSALWVRDRFSSAGLSLAAAPGNLPGGGEFADQPNGLTATIISAPLIDADPTLSIGSSEFAAPKTLDTDYLPILDSPSAAVHGRIVFVGYGIVDPAQGLDDYAGIDVNNSIVFFLRGKPDHYSRPVSHADKIRFARNRGALAYLTATGPILHPYEARRGVTGKPTAFYAQAPPDQAIPGAWISTPLAESLLAEQHAGAGADRLRAIQEQLNKTPSTLSIRTDRYASLYWTTRTHKGVLTNVTGFIPGTGPDAIVIGAHRDHFGRPAGLLFPGADDNASGTAVLLETARVLAKTGLRPQRTILFVSFSGEEMDLLGSRWYVAHPTIPLSATKAMINIDHAGIGNGRLTVGVTGLDKALAAQSGQAAGLADTLDLFGFFPGGDHVPFKEAGVPTVTVVSGGIHPDFHQTTDTEGKIQPAVLEAAARYVITLAWKLANPP